MIIAGAIGLLTAGAVYLFLQRGMIRIVFGFILLSNAVNLLLISVGGNKRRGEPLLNLTKAKDIADPIPESFVLTAIVISFAITVFMLTLGAVTPNDDTNDRKSEIEFDEDAVKGAEVTNE